MAEELADLIMSTLGLTDPQLQLIVAALYLFLMFMGSISLGYLVVRFTYSEVRTFTHTRKLLSALAVGILITLTALGIDYVAFADKVLQFDSATMFFMFATTLLFFLILRIYFVVQAATRQFVTVGIPLPQPAVPAKPSAPEIKRTIEISKKIEQVKAQIQQAQQVQVALPTPAQPKPKPVEVRVKIEQKVPKAEEKERKGREEKLEKEREKAQEAAEAERRAKELVEREKERELKKLAEEKAKLENQLKDQLKKHEEELKKLEEKRSKAEKPVEITLEVSRTIVGEPEKIKPRAGEPTPTAGTRQPTPTAAKVAEKKVEEVEKVAPVPQPEKKGGFLDSLFGGKNQGPETAAQQPSEFVSWRQMREAKKEEVKTKEVSKPLPREAKKAEEEELEALIKTVVKEAKDQPLTGPQHRRYLLKEPVKVVASKEVAEKEEFHGAVQEAYSKLQETKQERGIGDVVKIELPKPAPMQVEKQEARRAAPQPKPAAAPVESGVSISDILGTDLFGAKAAPALAISSALPAEATPEAHDIFGRLTELAEAKPARSDVSFVDIKAPGAGCPTCHASNSKIIFCPYCGVGMCANCSPSIKPLGEGKFVYVCPKCGEEVDVHKK